ncbi:MAG: hypothetical protein U0172_14965 [Nitrospiraceae bacterium]
MVDSLHRLPLGENLPKTIEEIEVTLVEGREPLVELRSERPRPVAARRPPPLDASGRGPTLLDAAHDVRSEGGCALRPPAAPRDGRLAIQTIWRGDDRCRLGFATADRDKVLDLLGVGSLRIDTHQAEVVAVSLTDRFGRQATIEPLTETDVQMGALAGQPNKPDQSFGATRLSPSTADRVTAVRIEEAAGVVDLREIVAMSLVLSLEGESATVGPIVARPRVAPTVAAQSAPAVGFWAWEYREAIADPSKVLETCRQTGCRRLVVQMPALSDGDDVWEGYAALLRTIDQAGIEAFALDGAPELIRDPTPLLDGIRRLQAFLGDRPLTGLQLDIEPYLLKDFSRSTDGYRQYLATIRQVRDLLRPDTRLSMVMPFWFSAVREGGRPVAFVVLDMVDDVAIMSYRTDVDELRGIAEDIVRYGELTGKPVWLAVETRELPIERHVTWQRTDQRRLANAYVDRAGGTLTVGVPPTDSTGDWYRLIHQYAIRSERLSYSKQTRTDVRDALTALARRMPYRSLAGVLIHDVTGYRGLPTGSGSAVRAGE